MTPTPQVAETPLPLKQMFVLALVLLNESLCSTMLLPYVGFLIAHLQNRPAEESGYISGVLIGVFMLGQVVTAKYWGRMSDKYGRRVPLLIGLLSSGFMMLGFGLSSHVWNCIVFRFFHGFFNGNVFVAKTILADILDKTNESKGFVLVSLTYGFGTLLGPALGGLLYDPANSKSMQWAGFSKTGVFAQFPGLLPALAVLMYTNFAAFMCIVFLYESNKNAQPLPWWLRLCLPCLSREQHVALPSSDSISDLASERKRQVKKYSSDEKKDREIVVGVEPLAFEEKNDTVSVINGMERLKLEEVEMEEEEEESYEEREGIRMNGGGGGGGSNGAAFDNTDVNTFGYKEAFLLPITRRVLVIYMFLCAADVTYAEIFPLWVIAKESVGGLNYHSDVLGLFLLSNSFPCVMSNLLFHVAYRLIPDRMTLWRIAVFGMALAVAVIPFASYAPRTGQLILILVCSFTRQWFAVWAFNLITVLTAHVAPSGCVGTMYGIGQSCGASMRGLVPVMVTPLFAWSISGRNIPPFDHMFVFLLASVVFIIGGFFSYGIKTDEDVATEIVIEEEEEEEYIFHEERNSTNAHNQAFLWQQCEEEEEKGDQQRGKG